MQRNDGTVAVQLLRNVILRITLGFAAFGPSWGSNNFSSLKQNHYSSYSVLVLEISFFSVLVFFPENISVLQDVAQRKKRHVSAETIQNHNQKVMHAYCVWWDDTK